MLCTQNTIKTKCTANSTEDCRSQNKPKLQTNTHNVLQCNDLYCTVGLMVKFLIGPFLFYHSLSHRQVCTLFFFSLALFVCFTCNTLWPFPQSCFAQHQFVWKVMCGALLSWRSTWCPEGEIFWSDHQQPSIHQNGWHEWPSTWDKVVGRADTMNSALSDISHVAISTLLVGNPSINNRILTLPTFKLRPFSHFLDEPIWAFSRNPNLSLLCATSCN